MAKSKKSALSGITNDSIATHAGDDISYGNAGPPAGIKDGVAKLSSCYFDEHKDGENKGKPFFRAAGIIISPVKMGGKNVAGLHTSIFEACYETKSSFNGKTTTESEHFSRVMNEMRKLGADTSDIEDGDELEALAKVLADSEPHFNFSTTASSDGNRVWENWNGECDEPDDDGSGDDVDEGEVDEAAEASGGIVSSDESVDLMKLAGLANDDTKSATQLKTLALENGVEESFVDDADSWEDVAKAILEGGSAEEEAEAEPTPEKGDVFSFKPKGKKKALEVTVTAVFPKKKVCNVKDESGIIHQKVPYNKLTS